METQEFLESERHSQEIIEHAPIAIGMTGLDGRFLQANAALCNLLGYSKSELLGTTWMRLIHPDDLEPARQELDLWRKNSAPRAGSERRYLHCNGNIVWVRQRVSTAPATRDNPLHFIMVFEEATKRTPTLVGETVRQSEEQFRIIAEGCPSILWATDAEGSIQFINQACREFLGVGYEQVAGDKWKMVVHPDDAANYVDLFQRSIRQRSAFRAEVRVRRADGEWRWVASHAEPHSSSDGRFLGLVGVSPDITERKQSELSLRESEEQFRQITENIHEVFWMMTPAADELLYVSPACEKVWERSSQEFYRNPMAWMEAIHPDDLEGAHAAFARQIQGELVNSEYRLRMADGRDKWIRDRAFPVRDERGQLIRIVGIAEEITEAKRFEQELILAREAANAGNAAKGSFLANMSHEIRTPLNGIIGMTDLVLETELSAEQREYLKEIKTSGDALLSVINDILDFSKIEAGKIELEAIDFNLADCLETILRMFALRGDEKQLELLCDVAPGVPQVVNADPNRLRQVLINLVGNAIKFTSAGEVLLKVEVESAATGAAQVLHFTVSDTGIGIPPEKQNSIFDPFSQADVSTTRKYGGTGLGLTISSRLVTLMGGRIWVESQVGLGTQIHFLVSCKNAKNLSPIPVNAHLDVLRGCSVLIVDDNRSNLRILEAMFREWGATAKCVESGEQALMELSPKQRPTATYSFILVDAHMPVMDGFTLFERIRDHPELNATPIVMLTSAGKAEDAQCCRRLGAAAHLFKPIRQSDLGQTLAGMLGPAVACPTVASTTGGALPDAARPSAALSILLAEDNRTNQILATRLLEKRGHRVLVASDGLEAVRALGEGSFDLVFMDVQMPNLDGMEATREIREREKLKGGHQIIIALTAHALKGDLERCLAAGMDEYLTKPIRPKELDDLLGKYQGRIALTE